MDSLQDDDQSTPDQSPVMRRAEVVADLAILLAREQLKSQLYSSASIDSKLATVLGFTAVFAALTLGTGWHGFILIPMIPAFLTLLVCLLGLLYGRFMAGPDPQQYYESNYAIDGVMAKQVLLSELQAAIRKNQTLGINKSAWLIFRWSASWRP